MASPPTPHLLVPYLDGIFLFGLLFRRSGHLVVLLWRSLPFGDRAAVCRNSGGGRLDWPRGCTRSSQGVRGARLPIRCRNWRRDHFRALGSGWVELCRRGSARADSIGYSSRTNIGCYGQGKRTSAAL